MMRVSAILPTLVGCIYQPDDIILVDVFVNQIDLRMALQTFPLKGFFTMASNSQLMPQRLKTMRTMSSPSFLGVSVLVMVLGI